MTFFKFYNSDLFEMMIVANPDPLFLLKITELSNQIRKQLWNLVHTAETINVNWIGTLAQKIDSLNIKDIKYIWHFSCIIDNAAGNYHHFDNPCFIKNDNNWLLGNILHINTKINQVTFSSFSIFDGIIKIIHNDRVPYSKIIKWDIITTAISLRYKLLECQRYIKDAKTLYCK
jgi:hypothetical protein